MPPVLSSNRRVLERCVREVKAASVRGADHLELRRLAASLARPALACDVACWATLDPVTVMWTHCHVDGMSREESFEQRLFEAEYVEDDVATFSQLTRAGRTTAILSRETSGDLARSARHRMAFAEHHVSDELRLVLAERGVAWGSLQLLRTGGRRFEEEEAELLEQVAPELASALRHSLLRAAVTQPSAVPGVPPGLVLLRDDGRPEEVSPEATRLLGEVISEPVSMTMHALAIRARADEAAPVTVPDAGGGLLTLHATRIGRRVGVIVERASPMTLANVVARALGLTDREREVAAFVARGLSTKEIATAAGIREWTVQDHLKSVFAKTGVNSRQALVAALFFGYWAPEHRAQTQPSPFGHYLLRAK